MVASAAAVNHEAPPQEVVDKFVALCHGRLDLVQSMLKEHPALINMRSKDDETGIQAACHTGQKEIVKFLLSQGAVLDICVASLLGMEDDVRGRLDADAAQIDVKGAHGLPVMLYAALGGNLPIARLLFERGAVVDGGDGIATPLHGAVWSNAPEIAELLLANGARTDAKDFMGKTPRESAEAAKREQVLQVFARHGAA